MARSSLFKKKQANVQKMQGNSNVVLVQKVNDGWSHKSNHKLRGMEMGNRTCVGVVLVKRKNTVKSGKPDSVTIAKFKVSVIDFY